MAKDAGKKESATRSKSKQYALFLAAAVIITVVTFFYMKDMPIVQMMPGGIYSVIVLVWLIVASAVLKI